MRHQSLGNIVVPVSNRLPVSQPWGIPGKTLQLLVVMLMAASCLSAMADNGVRAVRLSNVVGTVQILNGAETQFTQAYPNMPLMQGSTVKTGEDGRAEIQFEDGSIVRLTPNSSAVMSLLRRNSEGNTNTEVTLQSGLSYVTMSGLANQRFLVRFGSAEAISPAPVKFRVNLDANPAEFAVLDGSVNLSSGTVYSVDVKANETVRFDAADSGRYFLAQGVDGDSWDQWNSDRDQAMSQMASQQTREARGSMNPNDPGWSDLDYYGNWYSAPGGGNYWAPSGAGSGWDPYGSGYWGYYGSGGGYSWISGYPWGWLPYHCGTWNYYNTVGWGWAPGGCGGGWSPASGIGYAPPYYVPVTRPTVRPVNPTGHLPGHGPVVIPVDRGLQATQLNPRSGAVRTTVALNGHPIQALPKTPNPAGGNSFGNGLNGGGSVVARPIAAPISRPGFGNAGGGGQLSSVPVYRPVAPPSAGYHPVAPPPSFGARPSMGGGGGQFSSPRPSAPSHPSMSAPSMSAPSMSAPHASSGGGAVSAGGGRVK